jgi:TolA-binding protein
MSRCAALLSILIATALLAAPVFGQDGAEKDKRIAELEQQVTTLKQQLAEKDTQLVKLREQLAAAGPETKAAQDTARLAARKRMQQDAQKYTREQLSEAEQLYQVANKNWRSIEAKTCLEKMIQQFPDVNRTGCAVLYLGQMSEGAQREQYLKDAIEKYGDCYYGDGANVGAYARYVLATTYQQAGQKEKAKALFDEIRQKFPQALDHKGRLLVKQLPAEPE